MHSEQTLLTEGSISKRLLQFTFPIFAGNLFQQLYNAADALIVGNFLGSDALAAVSATGNLVYLLISFFMGIASGAGVAISRFFGSGEEDRMRRSIHTTIALSLIAAAILTIFGTLFTPLILRVMSTPEDVFDQAKIYIQIYFAGSISMVMYNSLRGIMQAVGDSNHPLYYLILSSVINVILDIVFIRLFGTGVGGAALATVISQMISAILCTMRLLNTSENHKVVLKEIKISRDMFGLIINYGVPAGMQNSVIGFANVVVQSNINTFGSMAVAGLGAYAKIEGFAFLPVTSATLALTTFVGQNLGAREYDRAKKGTRIGILSCVVSAQLIGLVVYFLAPQLIGAFTTESEAIAFGVQKSHTSALFFFALSASHCLAAVLRGAGKSVVPMMAMLVFWCVFRVIFLSIMVPLTHNIAAVNWVYPISWGLSTVFLVIYYVKADWVHGFERRNKQKS